MMRMHLLPLILLGVALIAGCGGDARQELEVIRQSDDFGQVVEAVVAYQERDYASAMISEDIAITRYYQRLDQAGEAAALRLAALAGHRDFRVRAFAIEGIEYLHGAQAVELVGRFLVDHDPVVRLWAERADRRLRARNAGK